MSQAATGGARSPRGRARRLAVIALTGAAALAGLISGIVLLADPTAAAAPALRTGLVAAGLLAALAVVVAGPLPSEPWALRHTLGAAAATHPMGLPGTTESRAVRLATASAPDFALHLRPRLRELAAAALATRGVDLDAHPERARTLLGDAVALVLPRDEAPRRDEPGPDLDELEQLLDAVEALLSEEPR